MAVFNGRIETTALLIGNGADINAQTNDKEDCVTPLHYAVEHDNLEMVYTLASYGQLNINIKSLKGFTPLYCAVVKGNAEIVERLLNHSSWRDFDDPQDPNSITSLLELAKKNHHEKIENLLLKKYEVTRKRIKK